MHVTVRLYRLIWDLFEILGRFGKLILDLRLRLLVIY